MKKLAGTGFAVSILIELISLGILRISFPGEISPLITMAGGLAAIICALLYIFIRR